MDTGGEVNKKEKEKKCFKLIVFVPAYPGVLYAIQAPNFEIGHWFYLKILKVFKDFACFILETGEVNKKEKEKNVLN